MKMKSEIKIQTVKTGNFEMDYFSFGAGERAFVIIPGVSVRSVMLSAAAISAAYSCFAEKYTVYVFDRKKNISEGYTVSDMADDTAEAMRKLGIKDADMFGCSQGGMIAQCMAVRYPELIHKLVLGSTLSRGNTMSEETLGVWRKLAADGDIRLLNRNITEKIYSEAFIAPYRNIFAALETKGTAEEIQRFSLLLDACGSFDTYSDLDKIVCPVLVIGSWADKVVSGEASVEIAQKLRCPLIMYSSYGHAVYDEAPDYKEKILSFFTQRQN